MNLICRNLIHKDVDGEVQCLRILLLDYDYKLNLAACLCLPLICDRGFALGF